MKATFFTKTNLPVPTIISIPRDQWNVPKSVPAPRPRSWFQKIKGKFQATLATASLATPLARMTAAALVFEAGKIMACLLAPELQPWSVAL